MRIVFLEKDGVLTYKIIIPAFDALEPEDRLLLEEIEKCRKGEINTSSPSR